MNHAPDISVSELRSAVGKLLDAVEDELGEHLSFSVDYYWEVPMPESYAVYEKPVLSMGQVSDDAASIRNFANQDSNEYVSIWHESQHLRGLFQAIEHLCLNQTRAPKSDR